jgi:hypothetical protein
MGSCVVLAVVLAAGRAVVLAAGRATPPAAPRAAT